MQKRESGYIGQRMIKIELPRRRKKERAQRRFMNVVKEDVQRVGVIEEDAGTGGNVGR